LVAQTQSGDLFVYAKDLFVEANDGPLERQPSQRTFDETLTVALALFSHSDNVLSKYRADGIAATIQVNPDL
jgi:hypothetical protein